MGWARHLTGLEVECVQSQMIPLSECARNLAFTSSSSSQFDWLDTPLACNKSMSKVAYTLAEPDTNWMLSNQQARLSFA